MPRCLLTVLALILTGCAGATLRQPFANYNRAYADVLNEQMLLNLARLHNGHPAYFLAVGAIDNKFTITQGISGGGNWANTDVTSQSRALTSSNLVTGTNANTAANTAVNSLSTTHASPTTNNVTNSTVANSSDTASNTANSGVVSAIGKTLVNTVGSTATALAGGNVSGTFSTVTSPEFQLIPLNSDLVAKQFLEPISLDAFFTLYQQGVPMDQLMRVMVERIETTLPDEGKVTLTNSPTGGAESFGRFLRACAILREMQRNGSLQLVDTKHAPKVVGTTGPNWKMFGKDLMDAHEKNLKYQRKEDGTFELIEEKTSPTFIIADEDAAKIKKKLYAAETLNVSQLESERESERRAIDHVVDLLAKSGLSVRSKSDGDGTLANSRLILRSYSRAMEAVATEQDGFDALLARPARSSKQQSFKQLVPTCERQPILRTIWNDGRLKLRPPLEVVHYAGQTYQITDKVTDPLDPTVRWNRDVFRMLVELGAQVSVDISKFQRQVLELR